MNDMKKFGLSNLSSFILAFLIYLIIVCILFFRLSQESKIFVKYSDLQDSFVDIELGQSSLNIKEKIKDTNDISAKEQDLQKLFRQTTNKEIKTSDIEQQEANLNSLFGNIKDFQDNKSTKVQSSIKSQEKAKSNEKASRLLKELNDSLLIQDSNISSNNTKEQLVGVYDKFLGAIRRNLEQRWRLYEASGNFEVIIKFFIDADGKFGYTEYTKSYNDNFDKKIENFLKNLDGKYIALPPNGQKYEIIMNLSDKIKNIGDV